MAAKDEVSITLRFPSGSSEKDRMEFIAVLQDKLEESSGVELLELQSSGIWTYLDRTKAQTLEMMRASLLTAYQNWVEAMAARGEPIAPIQEWATTHRLGIDAVVDILNDSTDLWTLRANGEIEEDDDAYDTARELWSDYLLKSIEGR